MKLYHYRSIENAILELKNGTFHFSTREELNDPLEGYLKIYWQGDKIAWEGLLKNYVCSVDNAIMLYLVQADLDMLRENTLAIDIYSGYSFSTLVFKISFTLTSSILFVVYPVFVIDPCL